MHPRLNPQALVLVVAYCTLVLLPFPLIANDTDGGRTPHTLARFDGSDIHYYLEKRPGAHRQPIVVVMQGSDCNSVVNNPRIREIADVAPAAAVLLVEKYGITDALPLSKLVERSDCPDAYLKNNRPEQRVIDYAQVVAALRRSASSWWNRRLIIIGGSEGSVIAEQVATIVPETERLIIFGFGARRFEDDVLHSVQQSMEEEGLDADARQEQIAKMQSMFKTALADRSPNDIVSGYSHAWWASMLSIDQLAALSQVAVPVLALQGSNDEEVSVEGARALISQLRSLGIGKSNIQYVEYAGLNHGFRDKSGTSHVDSVLGDMAKWLRERPTQR